ncbi:galactose-1-phosphate uridylyltransferase [Allorhodopirellula solitaria]|uniref:Galactose-1-phosphate uridylyltransferase n=1 Tax=Allorhodopirellula solitaria TaxID=2527987 RepID=A0A5C5XU42_9BACT|nr:DUF4921 family protein [Allorhodopirellula solitaria]TWT66081.1 Galactose-1-phosphate uridylyltransferase [Allorhodopirellula solitaria]
MPISHVDLNGGRTRLRRDSRQLRLKDRHSRNQDGDTLAQAAGETLPASAPDRALPGQEQGEPNPASGSPGDPTGGDGAGGDGAVGDIESRLCDIKAVFTGPCSSADPPTEYSTDDSSGDPDEHPAIIARAPIDPAMSEAAGGQAFDGQATAGAPSGAEEERDSQAGQSRLDLITGEWTWFATTRSQRPNQFSGPPLKKPSTAIDCPFCAGQEGRTPDPVWVAKLDDVSASHAVATSVEGDQSDQWSVRVVPNLYPAVKRVEDAGMKPPARDGDAKRPENEAMPVSARVHRSNTAFTSYQPAQALDSANRTHRRSSTASRLFPSDAAQGGHEVIIESPRHTESLAELNTAEVSLVFAAYAERIRYWRSVPGVQHVSIFKNVGCDAGASLAHSHSQLIATNRVPGLVQQVTRRLQAHHARYGSCLQCDLLRAEIEHKQRVVSQTDSFVAYCPFASRFPMQVRVTSKEHLPCFSNLRARPLAELARLTLRIVRWLEALQPGTAYNMLIHTCPVAFNGATESYHWAMDIFPRVSRLAGFELATGAMINAIYPEAAAQAYRAQARLSDPRYVLA